MAKLYSKTLPPEREGESCVYRSLQVKDELLETFWPGVTTLYEGFRRCVEFQPGGACLGTRTGNGPYRWMTYSETFEAALEIGSALVKTGLKKGDFVGLFSVNRKEWVITEHGSYSQSLVPVPLYDTLGPDASQYIINQTEMKLIVVSKVNLNKVLEILPKTPSLKYIIQMEDLEGQKPQVPEGVTLSCFSEFQNLGKANKAEPVPPVSSDLATICYTSGTTGDPKGVMLSHRALVSDISGAKIHGIHINPDDVHISYLPLAHMMERIVLNTMLLTGASVGFFRGDVLQLFDDLTELKPTLFVSVPRLWNRIYDKVMAGVSASSPLKQKLFHYALASKSQSIRSGVMSHALWDNLVFGKIRDRLGGRVRLMLTGSAPISSEVMDFLKCSFSCPVLEGYGQTETAAAATCTLAEAPDSGNVGVPLPSCEIKLVDVGEMGYTSKDPIGPRGEVCIRGPICCNGYFKQEEKTKELFDTDGWLHTGDIGMILPDGCLKIIDRKKNIFKLSQGEYVAPEKLENIFCRIPYLAQAFVHGESLMSSLVAVFVIDPETLVPWATSNNISDTTPEALCKNETVRNLISKEIKEISTASKLHGFEIPKAFHLTTELFTVENDLLTPTFKLKRPQAKKKYLSQIEEMYEKVEPKK